MHVLFITSSRLGDAVLSTSILHHLEKAHKNLDVTVVCGALPVSLFHAIPFVRKVIALHKKKYARHWMALWKTLRHEVFDQVIDLRGSPISYFLKTAERKIWQGRKYQEGHQVKRLGHFMGLAASISPKLWLTESKAENPPTLSVAPAANWVGKQWPKERFIEALKAFQKQFPMAYVKLLASSQERAITENIFSALDPTRTSMPITDDLNEVAHHLHSSQLFLGNDSGLMHMAAALNIPCIALFGPSDDRRYSPYGTQHIVLRTSLSLKEIEALPNFSYAAPTCYMETLTTDRVTTTLLQKWEDLCQQHRPKAL